MQVYRRWTLVYQEPYQLIFLVTLEYKMALLGDLRYSASVWERDTTLEVSRFPKSERNWIHTVSSTSC